MPRLTWFAFLMVSVQVMACGNSESTGDDAGPGGDGDGALPSLCEVQLDLDDGLTLGAFTQDQANQACDAYGDVIVCTFPQPISCRLEGIVAARSEGTDSPESCRNAEAECLLSGSRTEKEWGEPCEGSAILSGCTVTVAQLRQCWNDLFARTAELQAEREQDSCDDVAAYFEWVETAQDEQYPPSCDAFLACQEVQ